MAGRRSIGDEDHALWHLSFHASKGRLAVLGPNANAVPRLDPDRLHVPGMHGQGVHDGLILHVILPDVDLLPLPGRAARVHDEALFIHITTSRSAGFRKTIIASRR